MSVFRSVRWSTSAIFILAMFVTLACSKKDVKQDEPLINPSGDAGAAAPSGGAPTTGDAGAAGSADTGELGIAYFDFDSYRINGGAKEVLNKNAEWLKSNANATIQVEGHCDERGTTEYNLALGERRANAARDYLTRLGIDKSRISVISYGEERPLDPGHDEAAWAKNRRAVSVILSR